jgi:hypothetical protein
VPDVVSGFLFYNADFREIGLLAGFMQIGPQGFLDPAFVFFNSSPELPELFKPEINAFGLARSEKIAVKLQVPDNLPLSCMFHG